MTVQKTVESNDTNTYLLGHGLCSVGVTKDEKPGEITKWGVAVARLHSPLEIGDHIYESQEANEFDPVIIISEGKDGMRVLLRAVMKAYIEMGGDDPISVWEDSKKFFAEAAKNEK